MEIKEALWSDPTKIVFTTMLMCADAGGLVDLTFYLGILVLPSAHGDFICGYGYGYCISE